MFLRKKSVQNKFPGIELQIIFYSVCCLESKLTHILRGNPEFMEQLSLCLDRDVRFIPNWKHLASKLEVEVDVIKRLEQYGDFSPTFRLFYFLETSKPDLTIKELKETMLEIGRNDLLSLLTTEGNKKIIIVKCKAILSVSSFKGTY